MAIYARSRWSGEIQGGCTCDSAHLQRSKVINIERTGMLRRINRIRTKNFSIVTYSEVAAQSLSPQRHNGRRSRTSCSTAVQSKGYEPRHPRVQVPRRRYLPGRRRHRPTAPKRPAGSGRTLLEAELAVAGRRRTLERHRAPTATPPLADGR